jgi:hypothetical protein
MGASISYVQSATGSLTIKVTISNPASGVTYTLNWGDGTPNTSPALTTGTNNHTYSVASNPNTADHGYVVTLTGTDGSSVPMNVYLFNKFVISKNVNSNDPSVVYGSYYNYNNAQPVSILWGDNQSDNCSGATGSQPGLFHGYQNVAFPITASASNNGGASYLPVTFTLPVSHIGRIWFTGTYGAMFLNINVSSKYLTNNGGILGHLNTSVQFLDQYNNVLSIANLPMNASSLTGMLTAQVDLTQMAIRYGPVGGPLSIATVMNNLKFTISDPIHTSAVLSFPNYNLQTGPLPSSYVNAAIAYVV